VASVQAKVGPLAACDFRQCNELPKC
jgi:hypothetical protein